MSAQLLKHKRKCRNGPETKGKEHEHYYVDHVDHTEHNAPISRDS